MKPRRRPKASFLKSNPHPRAYGNFARVLGKYVREEKVLSLAEAVRRLSALPATNLGLDHRGFLKEGMFADVVVFDPATIADRATFEKPHQYAVGMKHVFVNGVQVLKDGEHTGAKPAARSGDRARFVRPRFQFRWANLGRARLRRTPGRKRVQPEITPRHSRVSSHQPFKPLPTARAGSAPVVIRTEANAEHCPLGGPCSQFKA